MTRSTARGSRRRRPTERATSHPGARRASASGSGARLARTLPRFVLALALWSGGTPPGARAQDAPLTLAGAVENALEADPGLAAGRARLDGAEADVARARAGRLPSLQLEGALTRFQEPMVVRPLHSFDPSRPPAFEETLVQGAARLRYTAFDGGATGARIRAAASGTTAADAGVEARVMETVERATASYLTVLSARAQEDAAVRRLQALEAEGDRARRRVETGAAAEVEALRASAALEEARAEASSARTRTELAERSLAREMGLEPAAVVGRPLSDVELASGPEAPDAGVPALEAGHPELVRAAEVERAAQARLSEQRAGRLPRLELTAGLLDYGAASGGHVAEWQAGVAVSWPLFTGGARGAAIRRAEADLNAARAERAAADRAIDSAVDAARAAVEEADARAQALGASVAQWEEVARIEALALDTGAGVQSDLLAAEASLFRARAGLARARYDRVLARVRLARARGLLDREWLDRALEVDG